MALLEIRYYPDPVLRIEAAEVTQFNESLANTVSDMAETMYAASGIGLAAPQVGISQRILVLDISESRDQLLPFINPVITTHSGRTSYEEGCLSIPDYRETIKRHAEVTVEYKNVLGETQTIEADGLFAICLQHEIDHLNGVLIVDHLSRLKREFFRKWWAKRSQSELVNS
jgi:peptide deformylase